MFNLLTRTAQTRPGNPDQARHVLNFVQLLKANGPLKSLGEVKAASALLEALRLPAHHDPLKNWDHVKCLAYVLEELEVHAPVLDVGSSCKSVFLRCLESLGYDRLFACDVRDKRVRYGDTKIQFSVQDLSRTNYASGAFQAITSISVIEHGVPLDRYAAEMSRLLQPGGLLLTTTDYWSEPVDCRGIRPYPGMPEMKIFQPDEIRSFCEVAREYGLVLCGGLDLATGERVVHWERVDRRYTFLFFAMRKAGELRK